jgi:hypothetical protein
VDLKRGRLRLIVAAVRSEIDSIDNGFFTIGVGDVETREAFSSANGSEEKGIFEECIEEDFKSFVEFRKELVTLSSVMVREDFR